MKLCNKCGAQVDDDSRFCAVCGADMQAPSAPAYAAQPDSTYQNNTYQNQNGQYQQNPYQQQPGGYQQQAPYQQNSYNPNGGAQYGTPYGSAKPNAFIDFFKKLLFGTAEYQTDPQDVAANKVGGIVSCFGILFFVPLCINSMSPWGKFRANQGLVNFLLNLAATVVYYILSAIINAIFPPVTETLLGYTYSSSPNVVASVLCVIVWIILFVPTITLWIMNLVYAIQGRAKELPVIGKFHLIK